MADNDNAHKVRIDTPGIWAPALAKALRLTKAGLRMSGERRGRGVSNEVTVTAVIREALLQFNAETDAQTVKRLKLDREN